VTLRIPRAFQLYAGYFQDRNNVGDARSDRLSIGFYASNLFRTGLELNVSDWRMTSKSGSSYDSWYVSLGKSLGQKIYVEGFYSSSVSVFRLMEAEIIGSTAIREPAVRRVGGLEHHAAGLAAVHGRKNDGREVQRVPLLIRSQLQILRAGVSSIWAGVFLLDVKKSDEEILVVADLDEFDFLWIGGAEMVPGVGHGDVLGRRVERPVLGEEIAADGLDEAQSVASTATGSNPSMRP